MWGEAGSVSLWKRQTRSYRWRVCVHSENSADRVCVQIIFSSVSCLGLAQQLLQFMLGQQAMVLHEGRDLRRSLSLIVHCAVDLHVPVENLQETFLTLLGEEGKKMGWWDGGQRVKRRVYRKRVCQKKNTIEKNMIKDFQYKYSVLCLFLLWSSCELPSVWMCSCQLLMSVCMYLPTSENTSAMDTSYKTPFTYVNNNIFRSYL